MTARFTLLTASAGSGKTYALTQELSRVIAEGAQSADGLRPHQIIATTFTKKAAAELVERTQQRLIDDGQFSAASEVEAALIGTVNSIAGRIVEMYAIDAGLSPSVRVLGEGEQERAFAVALDPVIAEAERAHRPLLRRLGYDAADGDTGYGAGQSWVGTVRAVVEKARANRLGSAELRESCERSLSDLWAMLDSVSPEVQPGLREQWVREFSGYLDVLRDDVADIRAQGGPANGMKWKSDGASRVSQSFKNVEASIDVLEYFENLVKKRGVGALSWREWTAMGNVESLRIQGRSHGKVGKRPATVFAPLAEAIEGRGAGGWESPGLLGAQEFRADLEQLVRLVFSTAIEGLRRYEEYKKRLGVMDFVDQEALAVDLVTHNARVRESLASRYRFLSVDEFQDTSPIQLELFLRLGELVEQALWVGDPKQSIYGFRGAAPDLMEAVVAEATSGAGRGMFDGAVVRPLTHSYRSSECPVALVNALFTSVFQDMPAADVALDIPQVRDAERGLGGVRIWDKPTPDHLPEGGRVYKHHAWEALATGIKEMLTEGLDGIDTPLEPKDIAVLSRSASGLDSVVDGLRAFGIPAVGPSRALTTTREGHIVLSALALLRDPRDTLALTQLIHLLDDHAAHAAWFGRLGDLETKEERREQLEAWRSDDSLAGLEKLRSVSGSLSPAELMVALLDALDLPDRVKRWSRVEERLDNLDAFCTLAYEYQTDAVNRGRGMSVSGLYDYVSEQADSYRPKHAPNAVMATTVHQSKGLQWPVVISVVPERYRADSRDAVTVVSPDTGVDALHPLAGRRISFIPKVADGFKPLAKALASHDASVSARLRAQAEEARIQYVSLTRAKYVTVLAPLDKPLEESVLCNFDPAFVLDQVEAELAWPGEVERDESRGQALPILRVEQTDGAAEANVSVDGSRIPAGYPGADLVEGSTFTLPGVRTERFVPWPYAVDAAAPLAPVPVIGERSDAHGAPLPLLPLWNDGPVVDASDAECESDELILEQIRESDAAAYEAAGAHGDNAPVAGKVVRSPLALIDPAARKVRGGLVAERSLAARFKASASDLPSDAAVQARIREKLGMPLVDKGDRGWELVGEAAHAYLALPLASMTVQQRAQAAATIVERWLSPVPQLRLRKDWPGILVESGDRWHAFLERAFPGAQQATEVPVSMWNDDAQVMEGWIDSLLEIPGAGSGGLELVLVDHKTFPDPDPTAVLEHVREQNAGQLAVYLDAIEHARGIRPSTALIHLPLSGYVVEVHVRN